MRDCSVVVALLGSNGAGAHGSDREPTRRLVRPAEGASALSNGSCATRAGLIVNWEWKAYVQALKAIE
jgi:hypothetical protein